MEIKNKVIIITGASEGIGFSTAKYLSKKGAKIVLAARSGDKLKKLEKELSDSLAVIYDLRKHEDIKNLVKKAVEKYGRIDILINNAGQGMYEPVENIKIENLKQIMELNVYAVILLIQEVVPIMRKQGGGMIINVSSGVSKRYIPGISAYSSTKYALNAITFIARQELEKDNIIVCSVVPKMTSTRFGENSITKRPDWSATGRPMLQVDTPEQVAKKLGKAIISEVEEIVL